MIIYNVFFCIGMLAMIAGGAALVAAPVLTFTAYHVPLFGWGIILLFAGLMVFIGTFLIAILAAGRGRE